MTFAIYRYISIYGSLRTNWMVSGGQKCIVDKSCDARECPAMPASALRSLRGPCNSCRGVPALQQLTEIREVVRTMVLSGKKMHFLFNRPGGHLSCCARSRMLWGYELCSQGHSRAPGSHSTPSGGSGWVISCHVDGCRRSASGQRAARRNCDG